MRKKPDLLDYLTERSSRAAVVGLILVLIGFLISDLPVMIQSQAWSTTKGEITYRQLSGIMYYTYEVGGSGYRSHRINALDSHYYPGEVVRKYPEGQQVVVYYDSRKPSRAVLEPGFVYSLEMFNLGSSALLLSGVVFLYQALKKIIRS